jgi:uncharacterized membrane protein YqaE (UPF0057 family)
MKIRSGFIAALAIGILFSSCGMMKNNDFSSRKYTHFKKGEAVVANNPVQKKETIPVLTANNVVCKTNDNSASVSGNIIASKQIDSKNEIADVRKQNNVTPTSSTKKERIQRTMNSITERLLNKGSTVAVKQYSTLLLVALAILIPPVSVFMKRGAHTDFWIDLVLAIIGLSFFAYTLLGLAYIAAIIYALIIVLK